MYSNNKGPYDDKTLNDYYFGTRPDTKVYASVTSPERPISGASIPVGYRGSNGYSGSSSPSSSSSIPNQSSSLGRGEPGPQRG